MIEPSGLLIALKDEVGKCVNCGFCESVCPTLPASGFRPNIGARGRINLATTFLEETEHKGESNLEISEAFYSCLSCYACLQVCPAGVNAGKVSEIGRRIIAADEFGAGKQEIPVAKMIVSAVKHHRNPFGVRKQCAGWANGLEFDKKSDTLLYTGNMYQLMAYNPALTRIQGLMGRRLSGFMEGVATRFPSLLSLSRFAVDRGLEEEMDTCLKNIYAILKSRGVRFDYLGEDEPYPGTLLYDYGYTKEFAEYASQVSSLFKQKGIRRIITVDPHTYDILKNAYPKCVPDFNFEVAYYLDYCASAEFVRSGLVTLHEPCYFALREGGYSGLGDLISRLADVQYPARSGKRTMCCGGPAEAMFEGVAHRVTSERAAQLNSMATAKVVTACPVCYVNLRKETKVVDVSGLVSSRLRR